MNSLDAARTEPRIIRHLIREDFDDSCMQSDNTSELSTENTTQVKPPFLKEKAQIETLTSINGLSIAEIEQRARPGAYSQAGFIGKEESFKEVLRKDWETVEKLQVTHSELAEHLSYIIYLAERAPKSTKKGYFDPVVIEYNVKDLKNNTISAEAPQKLEVVLMGTMGYQEDLFKPKDKSLREVDTPKK